jgi:hypothetical protein
VGASWDPSILQCDTGGPNGGVDNGSYLVGPPDYDLLGLSGTIDNVAGEINPKYGWSALGGYLASGNGTIAYIDFECVGYGTTMINLSVVLADEEGTEFSVTTNNVSFTNNAPPPPPAQPLILDFTNDPTNSEGLPTGYYLNGTTVTMMPVVVQQAFDNVTETYYDPAGIIWYVYYPNGSLATMGGIPWFMGPIPFVYTFNAADESELGAWTVEAQADVPQMNANWPSMNQSNMASHTKTIVLPLVGAILDLYTETERTHGYTATQIGVGECMPADSYALDENVTLYVNLTYNGAELQSRLIAWEVKNGLGETVLYRTTYTDANGVATITFRIMTICMDPEHAFGKWCVLAKTTVGEVVVQDYLAFQVGYIVDGFEVGDFGAFEEQTVGEMFLLIYLWWNIALEPRNVTYTVTITDDLGVPVFVHAEQLVAPGATWVKNESLECCDSWTLQPAMGGQFGPFVILPKWTYPGMGLLIFNLYTDYPWDCGVAWGPEETQQIPIVAAS